MSIKRNREDTSEIYSTSQVNIKRIKLESIKHMNYAISYNINDDEFFIILAEDFLNSSKIILEKNKKFLNSHYIKNLAVLIKETSKLIFCNISINDIESLQFIIDYSHYTFFNLDKMYKNKTMSVEMDDIYYNLTDDWDFSKILDTALIVDRESLEISEDFNYDCNIIEELLRKSIIRYFKLFVAKELIKYLGNNLTILSLNFI
jgi:hypothetical protein